VQPIINVTSADLLIDAFGRVHASVHHAVDGLSVEQLDQRLGPDANSIAWLVWHLTRVQDDHIADAGKLEQVWYSGGWADRFGLPIDRTDTGYGHSRDEVAAVAGLPAELLLGYHDAVYQQTLWWVRSIDDAALARVVDTSWDPPVTLAVRLISIIDDDLEHVGQAAFIRGIVTGD
jgi:uncharacterized damage-inducible protein DinB